MIGKQRLRSKKLYLVAMNPVSVGGVPTTTVDNDIVCKFNKSIKIMPDLAGRYIAIRNGSNNGNIELICQSDTGRYIIDDNLLTLKRTVDYPVGTKIYLNFQGGIIADLENNTFDELQDSGSVYPKWHFVTEFANLPLTSISYISKGKSNINFSYVLPEGMKALVLVKLGTSTVSPDVFDFNDSPADNLFNSLPSSNLSYTLAPEIDGTGANGGNFRVLYAGTATNITIAGLTATRYYRIQVLTYNDSGILVFNRENTANNTLSIKTNTY